jgi:hypothetical protein
VDPEDGASAARGAETPGDEAEAFGEALAVFTAGGHAEEPPRGAEDEDQAEREAIENQHPLTNLAFPGS